MIGQILAAFVADTPELTARVADRVRPLGADQNEVRPYLTYQEIDGLTPGALDGPSGLAERRLQVNVVSSSYGEAKVIARYLVGTRDDSGNPTGLDGFRGTLGGIDVRRIRLEDMRDFYDQPQSAESRGPYEVQIDFMVAFDESATAASLAEG